MVRDSAKAGKAILCGKPGFAASLTDARQIEAAIDENSVHASMMAHNQLFQPSMIEGSPPAQGRHPGPPLPLDRGFSAPVHGR